MDREGAVEGERLTGKERVRETGNYAHGTGRATALSRCVVNRENRRRAAAAADCANTPPITYTLSIGKDVTKLATLSPAIARVPTRNLLARAERFPWYRKGMRRGVRARVAIISFTERISGMHLTRSSDRVRFDDKGVDG